MPTGLLDTMYVHMKYKGNEMNLKVPLCRMLAARLCAIRRVISRVIRDLISNLNMNSSHEKRYEKLFLAIDKVVA
jgi:hypothetical protein